MNHCWLAARSICVFWDMHASLARHTSKIDQLRTRTIHVPAFCRWGPRGQGRSQSHEWTHTGCRRPCTVSSSPPWQVDRGASSSTFRLRTLSTELPVARFEASLIPLPPPALLYYSSPLALDRGHWIPCLDSQAAPCKAQFNKLLICFTIMTHAQEAKLDGTTTKTLMCPSWETPVVPVSQPETPVRDKRGHFVPVVTGTKGAASAHVAGAPFCSGWCYQPGQKVLFFMFSFS